jgi:ABC-type transport system involved in cytochrome c biogenesis permease component
MLGLCTALLLGLAGIAQAQGDATRGAALAANRSQGLCVLCHALPGQPTALLTAAKIFAHWLATGLPLTLLAPGLAALLGMPAQAGAQLTAVSHSPALNAVAATAMPVFAYNVV